MKPSSSPTFKRFLSDFTLGFSDGLTVPFALTAGLSSLGKTDTVITGGLAELCAGSISMGIGGYLAALDECAPCQSDATDVEEVQGMLSYDGTSDSDSTVEDSEKVQMQAEDLVRQHLEPLGLPSSTVSTILNGIQESVDLQRTVSRLQSFRNSVSTPSQPIEPSPIVSGLSISLGYAIGGIIPLLPYFFASTVGMGLRWSVCFCLVVLFGFGLGKSWILRTGDATLGSCVVKGLQMLILGAAAAGAAVACVTLVENR